MCQLLAALVSFDRESATLVKIDVDDGRSETVGAGLGFGAWSPDGRAIAGYRSVTGPDRDPVTPILTELWLLKQDTAPALLTVEPVEGLAFFQRPSWSPRGDWIATLLIDWDAETVFKAGVLYAVSNDGKVVLVVGEGLDPFWAPAWAPRGDLLAFTAVSYDGEAGQDDQTAVGFNVGLFDVQSRSVVFPLASEDLARDPAWRPR